MATYAVRRLGLAPMTEGQYKTYCKREALIKAGDKEGLKKLDDELAKKRAAKNQEPEGGNQNDGN